LEEQLQKYLNAFSRLQRGNTKYGIAPHKPILLISIIELIEKGLVVRNAIEVNANLVGTFKENWQLLVPTLHYADFTRLSFSVNKQFINYILRSGQLFSIFNAH
jgi:putative restriction endonuclease